MAYTHLNLFLLLISILLLFAPTTTLTVSLRRACSVTKYRGLCVRTLTPFSGPASSPARWARAGVCAATAEAKSAARHVSKQLRRRRKDTAALSDCAELLGDAVDELKRSLGVLRVGVGSEGGGDLATWMSAAVTDLDTCLEGIRGRRVLKGRVSRARRLISNALALVNALIASHYYHP